jgi:hypothetical protein
MRSTFLAALAVAATITPGLGCGLADLLSPAEPYALDPLSRRVPAGQPLDCRAGELVSYGGTHLTYHRRTRVHPAFAERLARFEQLAVEVATEVYGRAPSRLYHYGAYSCRRVRGRAERLSEHAFGNALDVAGFRFGRLPRDAEAPQGLPDALRRSFELDVEGDFHARRDSPVARHHAEFFRRLMEALEERDDIFRGMIGPPARGHHNHLHLDTGRWRYQRYRLSPPAPAPPASSPGASPGA